MEALGWWLLLVGSLRLARLGFRLFIIWAINRDFSSNLTISLTEVQGRTFGFWTLLNCTLCYFCAFNLDNRPLYLITFLSFIYAFVHFLTEYLIYETKDFKDLTTVGYVAGIVIHPTLLCAWYINNLDVVAVECTPTPKDS